MALEALSNTELDAVTGGSLVINPVITVAPQENVAIQVVAASRYVSQSSGQLNAVAVFNHSFNHSFNS
jgi:hypothetical protein